MDLGEASNFDFVVKYKVPTTPAVSNAIISFTPDMLATKTKAPSTPSSHPLRAFFPSLTTAAAMIANTAGLIPKMNGSTSGS